MMSVNGPRMQIGLLKLAWRRWTFLQLFVTKVGVSVIVSVTLSFSLVERNLSTFYGAKSS